MKILDRLLFKMGLMTIPKNKGNDVVFTWTIMHKGRLYGLLCRCDEVDLKCIKNSISHIPGTIERTLQELNIFPRPEGYMTEEMWKIIEKEKKKVAMVEF